MNKIEKQIANLRTLQESYDALATRNIEQEEGRKAIAQAITSKGVPTAEDASMQQMAENVSHIAQESYELQGDKIYEQQMFGAETISTEPYKQNGPLWNLYKVMTDLLSDNRFVNYGGILLAEYYKGYDTIDLMNAGAGGAYFTCDGDFYTTDKVGENAHVWHDGDNGMANRWVAYLFAAPESNYTIPSTALCPRSIHIGRKVGTIFCSVAGRITDIVCTDGNSYIDANFTSTQVWQKNVILRGLKEHNNGYLVNNNSNVVMLYCEAENINDSICNGSNSNLNTILLPKCKTLRLASTSTTFYGPNLYSLKGSGETRLLPDRDAMTLFESPKITVEGIKEIYANRYINFYITSASNISRVEFRGLERIEFLGQSQFWLASNDTQTANIEVLMPDVTYIKVVGVFLGSRVACINRIKLGRLQYFSSLTSINLKTASLADVEVGDDTICDLNIPVWNPTNVLATPEGIATINANIRDHIAAKVSDRTGQTALTFTVSTNLYNNLEQATIDAFTAKNWNVLGA